MKSQIKKLILFISAVVMLTVVMCFGVSAFNPTGKCGENVYWNYNETTGELVISGQGDMYNYVGYNCPFYDSDSIIKSVILEDGITSIGSVTFYGQEIEKVVFPVSLKKIGVSSFEDCDNLIEIVLPDGLEIIDSKAFSECDNLESIKIPNTVIEIGKDVIYGTPCYVLAERENGVLYIGNHLIDAKPLAEDEYKIKDGVVSIASNAFSDKKDLEKVIFPKSLRGIGGSAFSYCDNLENFVIPDSVVFIGESAFSNCKSVTEINIPDSVQLIESNAFSYCNNLEKITVSETVRMEEGVFTFTAYYNNEANWRNNLLYMNNHLIGAKDGLREYTIKEGTVIITGAVFMGYSDMETISIPKSISYIDIDAFYDCDNLKDVYFGGSEEQWNTIVIERHNQDLLNATIHFENKSTEIPDEPPTEPDEPSDNTDDCSCNCHKGGFIGFIYKILRFFWKLFKTNPVCACGVAHY